MSGIKKEYGGFDVICTIDAYKSIYSKEIEQDFLNSIKSEVVNADEQFDTIAFVDRIQMQSEILHELSRSIRWATTVDDNKKGLKYRQ
jgi:hypothetical protein